LRSEPEHELMGLDMPEMGAQGYSTVDVHMHGSALPRQSPRIGPASGR